MLYIYIYIYLNLFIHVSSQKASSSTNKVKRLHHPSSRTKRFKRLLECSDLRRQAMATLRDTQKYVCTYIELKYFTLYIIIANPCVISLSLLT